MLSCADVIAELGNYLDDELAAEIRRELEIHISECRTCEVLYDSARKTLRIVTEARSFELPESVSSRIVKEVMSKIRRSGPGTPPEGSGS